MPTPLKRFAQVGIGGRSEMYTSAILEDHKDHCELVALCDTNPGRMALRNRYVVSKTGRAVPTYDAADFARMIAETRPQTVIVTTGPDVTHSDYIVGAMELGCDVITEKPMTTDEVRCRQILKTAADTGRKVQVTFNARYSPPRSQIKEILTEGIIGEILSVDFTWMLDTKHGADYFRRWHRRRENSGALLVHKATHHFDLVNWWLDDLPEEVFCHASLRYYTQATVEKLSLQQHGQRCLDGPVKDRCNFHIDLAANEPLKTTYLDNEHYDGYLRDKCVFSEEIDIWDSMSVSVRYRRGAILNYMLHAYCPYEGYRIAFNGTKGRLEHTAREDAYSSGDGNVPGETVSGSVSITLIPEFSQAQVIEPRVGVGGHGGGDSHLLNDLFDPSSPADPLARAARPARRGVLDPCWNSGVSQRRRQPACQDR